VLGTFNYSGTRDYGSAVIYDGKVLIAGGDGATTGPATKTAEVINLNASSPSWSFAGSLAFARRQFNLTLLPDGKALATHQCVPRVSLHGASVAGRQSGLCRWGADGSQRQ
jgi:hypothetical protein